MKPPIILTKRDVASQLSQARQRTTNLEARPDKASADTIAVKRLSAVEINPVESNQHEFHAGRLRSELLLPEGRTEGTLEVLYYLEDGVPPLGESTTFTLYNSREGKPRAAEYRLYYKSGLLSKRAKEGDLLLLLRSAEADRLSAVVFRHGTAAEREALEALKLGLRDKLEQFVFKRPPPTPPELGQKVLEFLVEPLPSKEVKYQTATHPLFELAVHEDRVPSSRKMAAAASELVQTAYGTELGADDYLFRLLEAETELYYSIENANGSRRLRSLAENGSLDLATVIAFAMRIQQSRKSRRGLSLQNHLETVLQRFEVPYDAQRETEKGETPDFLIPGAASYHDPAFPSSRLRMVACKSTARERWRQVLNEARRIPAKYLLTLDDGLSLELLKAMNAEGLGVFMPRMIRDKSYPPELRVYIGHVADLLRELRAVL